jgi:ubiquinol-cytochrome c reductase cytochrome c subunit
VNLRPAAGGPDLRALGGWAAALAVVAIITVSGPLPTMAGALTSSRGTGPGQSVGGASAAVTEAGTALFQSQCASCHGTQGQGTAYGPSLVGAGAAGADFYLRTGPDAAVGSRPTRRARQPILSDEQIQELVGVVASLGAGPTSRRSRAAATSRTGRGCTSPTARPCHGATGPATRSVAVTVAANLHEATSTQIVEAMRIGPGAMPKFAFSADRKPRSRVRPGPCRKAPSPGGLEIGGLGAVAEGFVAIGIGLVLFVLATMFVGRRSREGDPPEDRLP